MAAATTKDSYSTAATPRVLRRSSSFFRRELSGSYSFAIVVTLALCVAVLDPVKCLWGGIQVVRSLCPARFAHNLPSMLATTEQWCWQMWRARSASAASIAPRPILELTPDEFDAMRTVPTDRPFVVRGYLNRTRLRATWTAEWLSESPGRGDMPVDFFTDAREAIITPDARAPLREVVANITAGGAQKLATEMVFRAEPAAVGALAELSLGAKLGRQYFTPAMLGTILTMPLFMARGDERRAPRTDMHCEPIANAVLMLEGSKRWTLLAPEHSHLVSPQVSPDGRAYFYARIPAGDPAFGRLPRHEVRTYGGDVLFVPTWTWHRVDYDDGVLAIAVSLFHFRPFDFGFNHPTYAALLVPNLVKELFGLKKQ